MYSRQNATFLNIKLDLIYHYTLIGKFLLTFTEHSAYRQAISRLLWNKHFIILGT
jgi:hypothetical protein